MMNRLRFDRRMLDFCVGLDTEFSELVEGSHLYFPKTKFDSVSITSSCALRMTRDRPPLQSISAISITYFIPQ